MKCMVTWSYSADKWPAIMERWNEGHTKPLEKEGCKFLGRWHGAAVNRGFMLYEVDDPLSFAEVLSEWRDLLDYEVTLVTADEEIPEGYTIEG